jgi:hypothetical protein
MNCRLQLIRFYETIGLVISPGVGSKAVLYPPMSGEYKAEFGQRYDVTQWCYRVKKYECEPHQGSFYYDQASNIRRRRCKNSSDTANLAMARNLASTVAHVICGWKSAEDSKIEFLRRGEESGDI